MLVAGSALFLSLSTSARTESACEALREWARPYEGATPTLDELAQFDRAHRIAIFNAVTPTVRAALVQDHLRRFSQRADLSAAQRSLIAEAITLATPEMYTPKSAGGPVFKEFWSRADKMFTTPEQRQPWFNLGSVVEAPSSASLTKVRAPLVAADGCQCNIAWNSPTECGARSCGGTGCSSYVGCGPAFTWWCDGTCQ